MNQKVQKHSNTLGQGHLRSGSQMSSGLIFLLTTVIGLIYKHSGSKRVWVGVRGSFIFSLGQPSLHVLIS